ncbi:MAG: hypothetical protein ACREXP_13760 [Steroidobacteraceae bacterium]
MPVTSAPFAAGGGGGGAEDGDGWEGVVEQAAAIDATTATHRRRKPETRKVDIGQTPMSFEGLRRRARSWRRCFGRAQLNRCHDSVRAIAATVDDS